MDIATKLSEDKKKFFEVEGGPLLYTREVCNIVTSILRPKAHHVNVRKQAVFFWKNVVVW